MLPAEGGNFRVSCTLTIEGGGAAGLIVRGSERGDAGYYVRVEPGMKSVSLWRYPRPWVVALALAARTVPEIVYGNPLEVKVLLHRHVLDAYLDGPAPVLDARARPPRGPPRRVRGRCPGSVRRGPRPRGCTNSGSRWTSGTVRSFTLPAAPLRPHVCRSAASRYLTAPRGHLRVERTYAVSLRRCIHAKKSNPACRPRAGGRPDLDPNNWWRSASP